MEQDTLVPDKPFQIEGDEWPADTVVYDGADISSLHNSYLLVTNQPEKAPENAFSDHIVLYNEFEFGIDERGCFYRKDDVPDDIVKGRKVEFD